MKLKLVISFLALFSFTSLAFGSAVLSEVMEELN
ncbi:MAG: hypothetical protein ACI9MC_001155 [Kiritimatiellia bacterium]|jgi:hypothetical protein